MVAARLTAKEGGVWVRLVRAAAAAGHNTVHGNVRVLQSTCVRVSQREVLQRREAKEVSIELVSVKS